MFGKGDSIDGEGVVESNHFGLPWPVDMDGNQFFGCVSVRPQCPEHGTGTRFCDAISGKRLSLEEVEARKNNEAFNYSRSHARPSDDGLHDPKQGEKFTIGSGIDAVNCTVLAVEGATVKYATPCGPSGFFIKGPLQHRLARWWDAKA